MNEPLSPEGLQIAFVQLLPPHQKSHPSPACFLFEMVLLSWCNRFCTEVSTSS